MPVSDIESHLYIIDESEAVSVVVGCIHSGVVCIATPARFLVIRLLSEAIEGVVVVIEAVFLDCVQ